jgi:hypothetical protein
VSTIGFSTGAKGKIFIFYNKHIYVFGADPDRIGLLGKPPAAEHCFPFKSQ